MVPGKEKIGCLTVIIYQFNHLFRVLKRTILLNKLINIKQYMYRRKKHLRCGNMAWPVGIIYCCNDLEASIIILNK